MASQQPPTRPWFRLASVSRPTQAPAPAPDPAPPEAQVLPVAQPRPPIVRSTSTQPSPKPPTQTQAPPTQAPTPLPVAAAPPPRATAPLPAPALNSLPPRAAATPTSPVSSAPPRAPTSTPSPSPKMKPLTFPPSPPTLPPPQLKYHVEHQEEKPKPFLVQETVEKHMVMPSNGPNHSTDITRRDGKPDVREDNGNYNKQSDSEEFGRRVITVAGQNNGAIMEWIPANKKNSPPSLHKNGGNPRTWSNGEKYGSESDNSNEEGRGKSKDKSYKARKNSSQPMSAFMNSNVQGVNNSILYNCSYSHHDPGVHYSLSRKANGHGNGVNPNNKDHTNRQNI